jgi:predicted unusual protein kinase regulating ubiquinone biosynthesis (AarF/ABC1/UbiB family)
MNAQPLHDAHVQPHAPAAGTFSRGWRVVRFLFRYWRLGALGTGKPDLPEPRADAVAQAFVCELEAFGPVFVKIGQALSTRAEWLSPAVVRALGRMRDDVTPLPWSRIQPAIETALGAPLPMLFLRIDPVPVGSASLAQVYRATLHDGREVAVKVKRPGAEAEMLRDLDLLARIAAWADRLTPLGRRLHFRGWIGEFRRGLEDELDYCVEADNQRRFAAHFRRYPGLWVPQPVRGHTCRDVLTMEFAHGRHLVPGCADPETGAALVAALIRAYLDQILLHGEIHADPHPGNFLITADGCLAVVDLGLLVPVSPERQARLMRMFTALVDGRGEEVADETVAIGLPLPGFDAAAFRRDIARVVSDYVSQHAPTEGDLLLDIVRLAGRHALRPPPELSLLGRALLGLEAVRQALAPTLDARRIMEEHLTGIAVERVRESFGRNHVAIAAHDLHAMVRAAPRQVESLLSILGENRLQVRLTGLVETQLVENLQKIANRIAAGVVVAALILASALMMRVGGGARLFGYPALALGFFFAATLLGLWIVIGAWLHDRSAPRP